MARLRVRLQLGDLRDEDRGSVVRVVVRDTTMADALHADIAEATDILGDATGSMEVTIDLPDEALDRRSRYSLWAHIDHDGTGALGPGDLITTQNVPVGPDDVGSDPVDVPLARI